LPLRLHASSVSSPLRPPWMPALFPYTTLFRSLGSGGKLVLFEKFSASRFWPVVEETKATYVSVVPSLLTRLLAAGLPDEKARERSEEHTSELQSPDHLVCRLLLEKTKVQT